jgi:hypothetical protein
MTNAVQVAGRTSLTPQTWDEAMKVAAMLAKSTMVPKDYVGKPENIVIAIMWGAEINLGPLQALQSLAVVNGRPSLWGDAMIGLVRGSGLLDAIAETIEGEGDARTATCAVHRKGDPNPIVATFSVADAKRAGLWKETPKVTKKGRDGSTYEADSGPWYSYPERMLKMRARGFALRDGFADVLRGVISAEEAMDIPNGSSSDTFAGTTVDSTAEPAPETPKKRTVRDVLDELKIKIKDCRTLEEFNTLRTSDGVTKAEQFFKGEAFASLMDALDAKQAELTNDDGFPGDAREAE